MGILGKVVEVKVQSSPYRWGTQGRETREPESQSQQRTQCPGPRVHRRLGCWPWWGKGSREKQPEQLKFGLFMKLIGQLLSSSDAPADNVLNTGPRSSTCTLPGTVPGIPGAAACTGRLGVGAHGLLSGVCRWHAAHLRQGQQTCPGLGPCTATWRSGLRAGLFRNGVSPVHGVQRTAPARPCGRWLRPTGTRLYGSLGLIP